ncbi:hypothetical protein EMIHUDRAFT_253051 [Emiliania huxleyi CCMP1516]|uniref:Secreted protein n=2 Tax=Emiliania huxleyi TaxID=2903 RepID=A0A0D3KD90_EMIH1|nr:hypothetical protein EMIHUDRAFT_253051 [Emiliania huxleyi CCMP1516]EOD33725.1 hypothetical protein EMIHUDRAFT_253051 [Emiliania huxleyi CCMP1516]|eukprot:XP_005786154.1 hypothetical protein EMIHUDRAFT_253051 [Emiliania huxleyi CCMP1516]
MRRVALASAALAFCLPAQWVAVASAAVACLTAATGRRLGASARLGVAIVASATRLDSTLSQELPHALARSLYNKLYSKIALYIALHLHRSVPRRMKHGKETEGRGNPWTGQVGAGAALLATNLLPTPLAALRSDAIVHETETADTIMGEAQQKDSAEGTTAGGRRVSCF